jgi:hypothetical protein
MKVLHSSGKLKTFKLCLYSKILNTIAKDKAGERVRRCGMFPF